jgi:hypothetical protein
MKLPLTIPAFLLYNTVIAKEHAMYFIASD